jgi:photosystem II stability/assembly factor-like uncharacterized protein
MILRFLTIICFFTLIITTVSSQLTEEYFEAAEFREIGPYRGGRSCAVAGVPGNDPVFYFGSTGGGIWKTEDGGRSWANTSDGYFGGSIGAIAIADSDPNVIYVGGGEKTVRGNVSYGYGIWKSTDAGRSWKFSGLPKSRHISRIRIHPTNSDIAWAAVMGDLFKDTDERGIYKTIDGGKTWNKVLFANHSAGAVDLVVDPNNPRNLLASTWNIRRTPYSLSSGGDGSSMWQSKDSGETWEEIKDHEGLPTGVWGISGVAISHFDSDRMWAIIENENGGVFRSDDGGKEWKKVNDNRSLRQRAWYYSRIYSDTEDPETVYVVNVSYHKSNDGGKSFKSKRAPHGDHHDLWIDPNNSKRMIIGDDGGAQVSFDGGKLWTTYHNQPTAQFYRVTTDNHFPYRIYAAQQDNSTVRIDSRSLGGSIGEDNWESTAGGESAHIAIDPNDNDVVYGGSYGGFLTRKNHRTNEVRAINVWPDNPMGYGAEGMKYRFQWNFPILFSKHKPNRLYAFSNHVHYTEDEGQSWKTISEDLTRNDSIRLVSSGGPITQDNTGVEYYCTIFAAAESPIDAATIWIGTDDGLVHITQDGGESWINVTPKNLPKWTQINSIEASNFEAGKAYIAATSYKSGDYRPYFYVTTDFGKSWSKIINGIQEDHFTRVIREDKVDPNILYAGTESGLYISWNMGNTWESFQRNLPIVPITDITIKNNDLIIATQGRGLWSYDYLNLLHLARTAKTEDVFVFPPQDTYRMSGWKSKSPKGSGTNKVNGLEVFYYMKEYDEKLDTIEIKIPYGDSSLVFSNHTKDKEFKIEPKAGSNHFVWDLELPGARKFDGMILWWGDLSGPRAVPGTHKVSFVHNNMSKGFEFEVLKNPNSSSSVDDIQAQYDFSQSVISKVDEAHATIETIRQQRSQIKKLNDQVDDDEITALTAQIDSISASVEKALYQTQNRSGQDPLNYPIKLTNKLAHLNSLTKMRNSDYPPTDQAIAVRDELIEAIDKELAVYKTVREELIPELNRLILKKEIPYID